MKNFIDNYSKAFWILVTVLIILTLSVVVASNYSGASERQALHEATNSAKNVESLFFEAEKEFGSYAETIVQYLSYEMYSDISNITKFAESIERNFVELSDIATGYFYKLDINGNTLQSYNKISFGKSDVDSLFEDVGSTQYARFESQIQNGPSWFMLSTKGGNFYIYAKPIIINNNFVGFAGFSTDITFIEKSINAEATEYDYNMLLSADLQAIAAPNRTVGMKLDNTLEPLAKDIHGNQSGYQTISINGKSWMHSYYTLPSGQVYVNVKQKDNGMRMQNILLAMMGVFSILCVWLVQKGKKDSLTPFEKIANKLMRHYINDISATAEANNKAGIAINFAIVGVLVMIVSFFLMTREFDIVSMAYIITFIFAVLMLVTCVMGQMKPKKVYATAFAALLLPVMLHLLEGGFSGEDPGVILAWMPISVILVLFLLGEKRARQWYMCFVILLFVDLFIEVNFFANASLGQVYTSLVSLLFICFALYASIELYVTRSTENYTKVETLYTQLKDAQSQIIQREKMVTLGQLIAGIAHEINTPIGAVKASADTLASTRENVLRALIENGKDLEREDMDFFFMLIEMSANGINDMKTTMEIRRSKKATKAYFESEGIRNADVLSDILGRLEISNISLIQQNIEFFKSENAETILQMANSFFPYITATQTILLATGKVTKIVFALKSYAHTNLSNEFSMFDIVNSVDNVLVLYHNALKKNIEVIKSYGEGIPKVFGNSDELGQVWTNIIQNAIYAMSEGGKLSISVNRVQDNVEVVFSDTGQGIPPDSIGKIFSPFFTTKPVGEGSGLGLDISKKIVEKHGGTISVKSTVGQGTSFFIVIPIEKT